MNRANYHTHTFYCGHAGGTVREYVEKALELNFDVLGFSEHGPVSFLSYRMSYDSFLNYLDDIEKCKIEFIGKIKIYKGLEIEYYEQRIDYLRDLKSKLDFMIFGAHFYGDEPNITEKGTYDITDASQIREYGDYVVKGLESGLFDMLAHPDLYMFNYPVFDDECKKTAHKICAAAERLNIPLELNANGIRRGLRNYGEVTRYQYPVLDFWKIAKEYKVKVIINSDCHGLKNLYDEANVEARMMAEELGLEIIDYLEIK